MVEALRLAARKPALAERHTPLGGRGARTPAILPWVQTPVVLGIAARAVARIREKGPTPLA